MINKICFENGWIRNKSKEIYTDPLLLERAIYAFELLGELIEQNVKFVFKGGTSLMLLIPELKRLSIDIDILTDEDNGELEKAFDNIIKEIKFNRWDEDTRNTDSEVPKRHFKFYYDSPTMKGELYVILDVLKTKSPYSKIIRRPISLPFFEVEKEIVVAVPSIDSLTGDKLTAFAPKTIGILYGQGKSMEIIKQLFDLGILFEHISDLKEVNDSYKSTARLECGYRNKEFDIDEFLNDLIDTSFLICQMDFRACTENEYTIELRDGIRRVKSHILGGQYSLLKAKEDASKVACLALILKDEPMDIDIREIRNNRDNIDRIKNIVLPEDYNILNKLKTISPESFYLWAIATKVLE